MIPAPLPPPSDAERRKRFRLHVSLATVVMLLFIYLSTGTLAPYALTLPDPFVVQHGYLVNIDHFHYVRAFRMIDRQPYENYFHSDVLRSTLLPLLAYLPMKMLGFLVGGVLTVAALHVAAFVVFLRAARTRLGDTAAYAGAWLLATYPGIYFWAGLPYRNAAIVPCCLLLTVLLWRLESTARLRTALLAALGMGVLFLGYDLIVLFAPAAMIVLAVRRKWLWLPGAAVALVLPTVINTWLLSAVYHVPLKNGNTAIYGQILGAYTHVPDWSAYGQLLAQVPRQFAVTFFNSNFIALPLLFLVVMLINFTTVRYKPKSAEWAVLLTALGLFCFAHFAPPYKYKWVLRGDMYVRVYQPIFAALLVMILSVFQKLDDPAASGRSQKAGYLAAYSYMAACIFGAVIVLGPVSHSILSAKVYHAFYPYQSGPGAMIRNLERYGTRPLGFANDAFPPTKEKKVRPTTSSSTAAASQEID